MGLRVYCDTVVWAPLRPCGVLSSPSSDTEDDRGNVDRVARFAWGDNCVSDRSVPGRPMVDRDEDGSEEKGSAVT